MSELGELAAGLAAELRRRQTLGIRRLPVPVPVPASTDSLDSLRAEVAACTLCELCETRNQTVFMDGTGSAGILFIGEAPGQNEDEQGLPFVGRAGLLLTDIIQKGMGLRRSEVAIANVLKCRPPGNRNPQPHADANRASCQRAGNNALRVDDRERPEQQSGDRIAVQRQRRERVFAL